MRRAMGGGGISPPRIFSIISSIFAIGGFPLSVEDTGIVRRSRRGFSGGDSDQRMCALIVAFARAFFFGHHPSLAGLAKCDAPAFVASDLEEPRHRLSDWLAAQAKRRMV